MLTEHSANREVHLTYNHILAQIAVLHKREKNQTVRKTLEMMHQQLTRLGKHHLGLLGQTQKPKQNTPLYHRLWNAQQATELPNIATGKAPQQTGVALPNIQV